MAGSLSLPGRARGLISSLLGAATAVAPVWVTVRRYAGEIQQYDAFHLPAFDPYVYVAMAEHPSFFTVAPWGYRVLTPWALQLLGQANAVQAYRLGLSVGPGPSVFPNVPGSPPAVVPLSVPIFVQVPTTALADNTVASMPRAIPNSPALAGATFHFAAVLIHPTTGALWTSTGSSFTVLP